MSDTDIFRLLFVALYLLPLTGTLLWAVFRTTKQLREDYNDRRLGYRPRTYLRPLTWGVLASRVFACFFPVVNVFYFCSVVIPKVFEGISTRLRAWLDSPIIKKKEG